MSEKRDNTEYIENIDECLNALNSGIRPKKVENLSDEFYDDMEWMLLVKILKDPSILAEIIETVPSNECFLGQTGKTFHRTIYQAMLNLNDDGKEIEVERLYAECEDIRGGNPFGDDYSRFDILELDFQAMSPWGFDKDHNRIRAKFCAEKVRERHNRRGNN